MIIRTNQWRDNHVVVHELGHALGLSHANQPKCPRGRNLCRHGVHRRTAEYGDRFDIMGLGGERFGAFGIVALGLAPVLDAPPGDTPLPAPGAGDPVLLRLRAADRDWYLESRVRHVPFFRSRVQRFRPAAIVSYGTQQLFPVNTEQFAPSVRYPRTAERGCPRIECIGRFLYKPGDVLTVPGVFRARIVRGRPLRVRTTWLDPTPPVLTVAASGVLRVPGAAPELSASLRADARGAGVLAVEVEQNGAVTRVPADTIRGLVHGRRGRGALRVPLAPGVRSAAVRLVDAAGNASPWTPLDLAHRGRRDRHLRPAARRMPLSAPRLTGPTRVTISGRTDPALAGSEVGSRRDRHVRVPARAGRGGRHVLVRLDRAAA